MLRIALLAFVAAPSAPAEPEFAWDCTYAEAASCTSHQGCVAFNVQGWWLKLQPGSNHYVRCADAEMNDCSYDHYVSTTKGTKRYFAAERQDAVAVVSADMSFTGVVRSPTGSTLRVSGVCVDGPPFVMTNTLPAPSPQQRDG
jgi:hypothetical protein